MNGKTAGNRGRRLAGALAVVAVVAVLAPTFRVHAQTTTSYPAGSAGSATYRQEIAFAQCLRSHGVPNLPAPPPGGSITPPEQAADACHQLAPRGREITNIKIVL
jgi:hypothetical protein